MPENHNDILFFYIYIFICICACVHIYTHAKQRLRLFQLPIFILGYSCPGEVGAHVPATPATERLSPAAKDPRNGSGKGVALGYRDAQRTEARGKVFDF